MLLKLLKVEGHSMEPELKNGSFFIASSLPYLFIKPKKNDDIIFKFKKKLIVKRINKINDSRYFIEGLNKNDSKEYSSLGRKEILGKVIWIL